LKKYFPEHELITPTRKELNVEIYHDVVNFIDGFKPDIVLHCAAVTDNRYAEKNPERAILTNIVGTSNVACACIASGSRLVYLSSDYVYQGDRGNYTETDPLKPFNFYAFTKLGGECAVEGVKNHLIIRTSFGKNTFDYPIAFIDKWSSKDYCDRIAPLISEAALSPLTGVLNIGTERKTLYAHAKERNDSVQPVRIQDTNFFTPYDTSLNLQRWYDYKSQNAVAKPHTNCRCCGSSKLIKYLDLGLMPLPNNLQFNAVLAKRSERFPLQVMFCESCGLSQLSVVIDPAVMFSYYTYRSGVNQGYIDHCFELCKTVQLRYLKDGGNFHIDIAGNDGTLLSQAVKAYRDNEMIDGYDTLNIDPATNLCAISEASGIPALAEFWSEDTALKVVKNHGQADLITATNVFAHVDNIIGFLKAAKIALSERGVLVLEFPYICEFIEGAEFDTVYHEHLSYMSLNPIDLICQNIGLELIDAEKVDIHGGSMRVTIANEGQYFITENAMELMSKERENGYQSIEKYQGWGDKVQATIDELSTNLLKLKKEGYKIAAFAASAKGSTLFNCAGINTDLVDVIMDETSEKIGKFQPGTGIPIVNPKAYLAKNKPDFIIILSWNFIDSITAKLREIGFEGSFICPIPSWRIL